MWDEIGSSGKDSVLLLSNVGVIAVPVDGEESVVATDTGRLVDGSKVTVRGRRTGSSDPSDDGSPIDFSSPSKSHDTPFSGIICFFSGSSWLKEMIWRRVV